MTEIKIPKTISGGGIHLYKVGYRTYLKTDEGNMGFANHRTQQIGIDPTCSKPNKNATLWHEILHKIDREYSCRIDEDNLDRLSEGITTVLEKDFGLEFDWSDIKELE